MPANKRWLRKIVVVNGIKTYLANGLSRVLSNGPKSLRITNKICWKFQPFFIPDCTLKYYIESFYTVLLKQNEITTLSQLPGKNRK